MKKTAAARKPRDTALDLVQRIEEEGAFVDRVLAGSEMNVYDDRDRRFIREMVIGVERHRLRLDRIIGAFYNRPFGDLDPLVRDILRLGLYQMIHMDSVPAWAAVNESVDIAVSRRGKGAGGLVNAMLRRFTREGEPPVKGGDAERISVETSFPRWLVDRWIAAYGVEEAENICRAGAEKHSTYIRPRRGRVTPEEMIARLAEENVEADIVPWMPGILTIREGGTGLFGTKAFTGGLFTVQDPSASLACELLAPSTGDRVLDLCAAPGGKATQCAEMMDDTGTVTAVDINEGRLGLVEETARRLGLTSIRFAVGDAGTFGAVGETYNRVLLDAPCSGTAVFSKRPDMKWRLGEEDIARLAKLQRRLLDNAARLTAPGGVLVYSTCSLETEENDGAIEWFLDGRKDFTPEHDGRFGDYSRGHGYLIAPHRMGGSGAYAVKLRRTDSQ